MAKKPLDYNYAHDIDFAKELATNLLQIWNTVRTERFGREEVWDESYRAWSADLDEADRSYSGMANLYIPQIRKEIETMSRRIKKGLFPEDYLRAEPHRMESEDITLTNTQVVRHFLDNVMNFKSCSEPWIKQGVLFGTSPIRTFWHKKTNEQYFRERYFIQNKQGILEPKTRIVQKEINRYNGPVARAEDIYNTWVYPTTSTLIQDIKIIFWRTKLTKSDLEAKKEKNEAYWEEGEDLLAQAKDNDHEFEERQKRMAQFGESGELNAIQDDGFYDLLECWLDVKLPGLDKAVPCVVEIINGKIATRVQRNGYWHQQPPFDWFRYIIPPAGEFYGRGLPEAGISLQHQLNDTANQGIDSATLALNNITIINPAFAPNAESFEIEPRAVWWADPNAVKQFQFPDLSDTAIKNMSLIRNTITEMSDNSPQLPDPIAGKARSTGQAQMALNEWQTDLFNFLENVTTEGLNPLAQKIHILCQQNLTDDEVIRITGKYADTWINRVVTPEEIVGNYDFKWIGALQIENQSVKTQQMLNFMKVYQSLPPEAQGEIKMKWSNFVTKVMRDGFLIRDIHNIIETPRMNSSISPNIEGKIMKQGGMAKVEEGDDDESHLAMHKLERDALDQKKDLSTYYSFQKHIMDHEAQLIKKKELARMQQQAMQMQMQMAGGQAALPPGQGRPSNGARPVGNTGQITESTNPDDILRGQKSQ